ncbi:MAG: hypothetical protein P4N59_32950, partial [Negativicutes bacterium]|nr:hypothetical protein [Negativicutes bacterium]
MGNHHRTLSKIIYILVITVLLFNSPGQALTAVQAANLPSAIQHSLAATALPPGSGILPTAQATSVPQATPTPTYDQHSGPDKTGPVTLAPIPGVLGAAPAGMDVLSLASATAMVTVNPLKGADITSRTMNVRVRFPAAALSQAMQVKIDQPDPVIIPGSLSGHPFEIMAIDPLTNQPISQFKSNFSIYVTYDPEQYSGEEDELRLFYFDYQTDHWEVMQSAADPVNHVLIAQSNHLTVFDMDAVGNASLPLPNLDGAGNSDYTGAATYSYPVDVPAGPGGFQPKLE